MLPCGKVRRVGGEPEPVGRHPELERLAAFLDAVPDGLRACALIGPAGIGKTTVWLEGLRRTREHGWRVLSARPTAAETRLSFAGLGDLLVRIDDAALDSLPEPQRRALDVALLRADSGTTPVDGRVVAVALVSLLSVLSKERPVVLAVDDAQWLDPATSAALSFAVRRLEECPIGVLVTVRAEGVRVETFERALAPDRRDDVALGPLTVAALHDILRRSLGVTFPRPVVVHICTSSAGNPFYALEIARELARGGAYPTTGPLPIPQEVRMLTSARLARLPRRSRDALLVASSMSRPTTRFVDAEALVPAEEDGIVQIGPDGRIAFGHPLLASAVYDSAPAGRRRAVHRALAEQVEDPERRARHLALATDAPDEDVATALDSAAARAHARGASAAAAELARRALELTVEPRGQLGLRRVLELAQYLVDAGESGEASAVLAACDPRAAEADLRAELLFRQGKILWHERDHRRGYGLLLEALEHARDPALAAEIHIEAAWLSQEFDPAGAIAHDDAVLGLVDPDTHPGPYSRALLHGAYLRLVTGQPPDYAAYERGVELQRQTDEWDETSPVVGMWPLLCDDFDRSRAFYEWGLARSRAEGDEPSVQGTLLRLVEIELWTGDWEAADELAAEGMELVDRISSSAYVGSLLYARGYLDAHLGRVAEARAAAERILELYQEPDIRPIGHQILGFLALSLDDPATADEELTEAAAGVAALGLHEPAVYRFQPDHVEAVIRLGDLERAEALIAALEERCRIFPRPWILATTARCRALVLSARGDLDASLAALQEALDHHARLQMPFERARTLLALGQVRRRRKERRVARIALEEALDVLETLGAPLWARRARAELGRVVARRAPTELTATEERIARLAASGLSNREIATQAFVSVKTVEANLGRAYRKLGISSRAQLSAALDHRSAPMAS